MKTDVPERQGLTLIELLVVIASIAIPARGLPAGKIPCNLGRVLLLEYGKWKRYCRTQ